MSEAQVLVSADAQVGHIRVIGQATFACSQNLRAFCSQMLARGVQHFYIDLSECTSMDSTFMGVLAMVGLRGRERHARVTMVNVREAHQRLLASLGVKKLFEFATYSGGKLAWQAVTDAVVPDPAADPLAREKTILEAHETLMALDPQNVSKFKDVVEFLREDIQRLQS